MWCHLGDLIYGLPKNGFSQKSVSYKTSIKTLKLGATTYGYFNPDEYKYITDKIPSNSVFWLEPGDILIQRGNSIDYVGVSAIYTGKSKEFIYPDLMMKIKVVNNFSVELMHKFLLSPQIRNYFRSQAKGVQKTMPKINQGVVNMALIPLPPFREQNEIINRINTLISIVDNLEKQVMDRKEQSEMLMKSVLNEAFEEKTLIFQRSAGVL
ncbi:MAG: hypothetical protein GY830_02075 [Bacteroidetes bacterium]|nr:hypothetical protein [Bacteroidota bacterium]